MAIVTSATDAKHGVTKYEVTWVSDAAGNVSGSTFIMKSGTIISVVFIPGVGALQPDNLYDVDMVDATGVTMFDNGAGTTIGANLSNAIAFRALPLFGTTGTTPQRRWHEGGAVQPLVAGAGDTNAGTIDIYVVTGIV